MDFRKVIMKMSKKSFILQQKYLYIAIRAIDIFEVL